MNVFETGALAPGVTVDTVDYGILSFDAGVKYKGIFLQTEIYNRWLDNFTADGPLPVASIHDKGFYVQAAFYPGEEEARGLRRDLADLRRQGRGLRRQFRVPGRDELLPDRLTVRPAQHAVDRRQPLAGQQRVRLLRRRPEGHDLRHGVLRLLLSCRGRRRAFGGAVERIDHEQFRSRARVVVSAAGAIGRRCRERRARRSPGGPAAARCWRCRVGLQRLALPPDQLHPAGHRHPTISSGSWARRVGRSTLFGIPLQQQWSYANSGDFAPTYYLQTDAPLYYYSFTDAYIASVYRSLSKEEQARFDPMITGFDPADMYARRSHSPRAAGSFPASSRASASSRIHKEFVSAKVAGETASLTNPALDRILDFAADVGLRGAHPQRHRHAVRKAGRRARLPHAR